MRFRIFALFISIIMCASSFARSVVVKATLDSATLLMGRVTALHVEISQDKDVQGYFANENSDTLISNVEFAAKTKGDTTDIDNGRVMIKRDFILQSFDSGVYVLPPLQYIVGKDTFETNKLSLKVMPASIDSLKTVHDYKPTEDVPFKFFDWVPSFVSDYWWVYLLVLLIIAIGLFVYFKWLRYGEVPLLPKKKRLPPYEEAVLNLESLKAKKLWQSGQEKMYYTELTDILRVYLERRFGINAVEMTTSQLLSAMRGCEETKEYTNVMSSILEIADFVKFANIRPLQDENEMSYQRALNFVNDTKPVEVEDGEESAEDNKKKKSNVKEDKK